MKFGTSENQKILLDALTRILSDRVPISALRKLGNGSSLTLRDDLVSFGLFGLLVDGDFGGSELKAIDSVLVSERLGYFATPTPYVGGMVLSLALRDADKVQQTKYLKQLSLGELRVALAAAEHCGAKEGSEIVAREGALFGRSLFVIDSDADVILVPSSDGKLFLVPVTSPNLTLRNMNTIDLTRAFGEIVLDGVEGEEIKANKTGGPDLKKLLAFGRLIIAADTLGACQRMLDDSVAYANQRKQFGRLIGSFQAVKHMCAEMAAKLEPCKAMIWHTACLLDNASEDVLIEANLCKAHLSEVGKFVAKTATEVHGGMGFTDLQGLHYWFKRIGVNRQLLGGAEYLRQEAARLQGLL